MLSAIDFFPVPLSPLIRTDKLFDTNLDITLYISCITADLPIIGPESYLFIFISSVSLNGFATEDLYLV